MPPISDLISFEEFFLTYTNEFNLKFVFVGILDDFIATLSKKVSYPCLYVERPTEEGDFDGNITFPTRLFYLVPGANMTDEAKRTAYNTCRLKLRALLLDLRNKNLLEASKKFSIDYKDLYSSDGLIGAFAEIEIIGFGTDYKDCG